MTSLSSRHHYLPKFYLKGFTGPDGKFAVFDIEKKRLKSHRLTPKQIFFEYDRNTFEVEGVKDDFVEKMYGNLETQIAPVFNKIHEQKGYSKLNEQDMFKIILFAGSVYWRIPKTDDEIKSLLRDSTPEELSIEIRHKQTGKAAPLPFYNHVLQEASFAGAYRMVKPILDYMKAFNVNDIENWKIYFADLNDKGERKELHLIGDNPVVFREPSKLNIFDQQLIMPLSSGKTLYHTKGKDIKVIPPAYRVDLDTALFLQSERYVCGPDAEYLEKVAETAYKFIDVSLKYSGDVSNAMDFFRQRIFSIFQE